jgi:uncharacterized YigZ family protein
MFPRIEMSDHFRTLAARAEFRQKIERSDFLGVAFPLASEKEFFEELTKISKQHFDATHHCWAFRLRERARSSDAGEPSGTAGKPILAAIEGAELFDLGVVVVRWYGGVKLGTGGLARAYRDTAGRTLAVAPLLDRYIYRQFVVTAAFDAIGHIYRLVHPPDVVLTGEQFGDSNEFTFDVRESQADTFAKTLTEKRLAFRLSS